MIEGKNIAITRSKDESKEFIVSFRGSVTDDAKNWVTNLNMAQSEFELKTSVGSE